MLPCMDMRTAPTGIVAAAQALAPSVADAADEIEATGRLPCELVERFTEAGLYHLYLPAASGGPEADPLDAMLAIEILARADGSAAWCAHVSSANSWQTATLAADALAAMDDIHGAGGGARRFSGSARPLGQAVRVDGGYRVTGRWDFASNCLHAQWYCGSCIADDGGRRRVRPMFMPITDGTIHDTWQVAGLRGTGSNDFAVSDVFVPDERVSSGRNLRARPGRLYVPRLSMVVNWALTAGVALGIARGALDAFGELAVLGTSGTVDTPLRDRVQVQAAVGRAEAMLAAARLSCFQSIGDAWRATGDDELDRAVPAARLAIVYAIQSAVDVVELVFRAGGTRAIFNRNGLERRFRDVQVAVQHVAGSSSHFEAAGRIALGLPAGAPFW